MPPNFRPPNQQNLNQPVKKAPQPGYDAQGRPVDIKWSGALDNSGNLKNQYRLNVGPGPEANTQALDALRGRGLAQGMSAWGNLQTQRQQQEQAMMRDQMAANQNTANSKAFNDLAMRGGLTSGARERIAMNNSRQGLMDLQNLNRQGAMDRMNIAAQDEEQKLGILKNLPQQELAALEPKFRNMEMKAKADEYNSRNALLDIAGKQAFDLEQYKQKMSAWGANKTADAQAQAANSGKK